MFIPISQPSITQLEIDYVTDAVRSTWISSLGKYIDRFESEFAAFCDSRYAVTVANGTVAIHLALEALGVGPGDEVIVPDLSFIATANAVLHTGAKPVFVDIEPVYLSLSVAAVEAAITPRTKAIIPVHLYGHPADMPALRDLASRHGLWIVEDAAEAHGACVEGKKVGSWGHCATFSFYGNKNLTTGEGGMITTDDEALYHRLRHLRDHAMSKEKRYWHTELGYNYRMTNMQAALGCAQLERVDELMERRQELFRQYQSHLADWESRIRLNRTAAWATNSYWLICAEFPDFTATERDQLMQDLRGKGVDTRPYFYPMSAMPYLEDADTPVSHAISAQGINLPTYFDLSEAQIAYICGALKSLLD